MKKSLSALAGLLLLTGCTMPFSNDAPPTPPVVATATPVAQRTASPAVAAGTAQPVPGRYDNADLGVAFNYPPLWQTKPSKDTSSLLLLVDSAQGLYTDAFYTAMPVSTTLETAAKGVAEHTVSSTTNPQLRTSRSLTLADSRSAWISEYDTTLKNAGAIRVVIVSATRGAQLVTLMTYGAPRSVETARATIDQMNSSLALSVPQAYGIPRDQALFEEGGESNNPRDYDPATGGPNNLLYSGLVMFNPHLQIVPDLAQSWDINPAGTVYTFHLHPTARFHDGRAVTASDFIYSWDRAADPTTASNTVLTYLGDIVGLRDRRAGKAARIRGLLALDDHTLQVTIDAPKPYFLMKLAYGISVVLDRSNVASGPEWYRRPNGSGPYRLTRWEPNKVQIYERNATFYGPPPAIRYVVNQLYTGVGIRLYETDQVDLTGVSRADVARMRDPGEPLHRDLIEGVNMCTSYISFDVTKPPFDDLRVRQAFALAVDKDRYLDLTLHGVGIVARGLYPPALPGHNPALRGLDYNPTLAQQRLAESRYGGAKGLPPIVFTVSGFGSDAAPTVAALVAMWQQTLGVPVAVENLEPDRYRDEIHAGQHGNILLSGWCADYPDPENFADALFHSGAEENVGGYSNPTLDRLLEQARVERDVPTRMALYGQAEQTLVDGCARRLPQPRPERSAGQTLRAWLCADPDHHPAAALPVTRPGAALSMKGDL